MKIRPATLDDIKLVLANLQTGTAGPNWVLGYASLLENVAADLRAQAQAAKAAAVAKEADQGRGCLSNAGEVVR